MSDRANVTTRAAKCNRDGWIVLALFSAALIVRLILAAQLVFPPLDDPAFYLQTARHLAQGRGFVSDVIWNYFVPFNTVTHPSNEFWMPLASLLMAGPLRLLGDTLFAAQFPGILSGALLAPVTYLMGRRRWPQRWRWCVFAAALLIPGAVLAYQAASADSAALFALLATLALWSAAEAYTRRSVKLAALCGVLCGLSYLTRSHGSLLIVAIALVWLIGQRRDLRSILAPMAVMIGAALIVIAPWWLRNVGVFGSWQPVSLLTTAAARDYGEWFNYTDLPSLEKTLSAGLGTALGLRWNGLSYCLGVILLITFPYGLIGLPAALLRREPLFRMFAVYGVLLWLFAGFIFTVPSLTGSFYHSAGVYAPWAALGGTLVLQAIFDHARLRRWSVMLSALAFGLVVGQAMLAWPRAIEQSRSDRAQFETITVWLREHVTPAQPILTTQAHTLNYASDYPALSVPVAQGVDELRQVADRYGVHYVVITERNGLYPDALNRPEARARLVAEYPDTWIYELLP